jgi:translation initiation factor 1
VSEPKGPDSKPAGPKTGLSKFIASRNFTAVIKLDSQSRKGKTVTVIDGLPKNNLFLEAMTKELKSRCGAGGTYDMKGRDGLVEIQGDQREKIRTYLASESILYKG